MATFITILIIIACLLLSLIVLIQNPKGGGLSSGFQSANQIGGVKRTADFLEKSTWTLGIGIMVLCLFSASFNNISTTGNTDDDKFKDEVPQQQQPAGDQGGQTEGAEKATPAEQTAPTEQTPE
jgi:preprotein translocase subunit SecG